MDADKAIEVTNIIFDQCMRSLWTQASNLYSITFNHTMLCGEGLLSVSKLVELCPVLQTPAHSYNLIDDINVATCFLRALTSHPCMNRICIVHYNLGNNPEILSVILQLEVKYIDLATTSVIC